MTSKDTRKHKKIFGRARHAGTLFSRLYNGFSRGVLYRMFCSGGVECAWVFHLFWARYTCSGLRCTCSEVIPFILAAFHLFWGLSICFWGVQFVLEAFHLLWGRSICFGGVEVVLEAFKLFWECSKVLEDVQFVLGAF